jgi:EAL and modified HD-GYP domain-containing signal transduction protein
MQDHPLLARLVLGYSAVIDRQRSVVATRLTLASGQPDAGIDGAELMQLLAEVWPESGAALSLRMRPMDGSATANGAGISGVSLLLNAAGESMLQALLNAPALPRFMIEVPAFMLADPLVAASAQALADAGGTLALKGRPREPLPPALAAAFTLQVDEASAPAPPQGAPRLRQGVRSGGEIDAAFKAGCVAVAGWPLGEPPPPGTGKKAVAPELQVILELINRVDREEPVERLEAVLKNDPTLAFRLIRYINSPGFGLSVEIGSFRHALMILGYHKLKRWLALLLASASKDVNMKPVMFAAVRRGLIMEELVKGSGDAELRGELFICGVFSLLDRLLNQPFADLLRQVPVPDRVRQALLGEDGPFLPYLELVQAIEQESLIDIRERADRLLIGVSEVNRALLSALASAAQLE